MKDYCSYLRQSETLEDRVLTQASGRASTPGLIEQILRINTNQFHYTPQTQGMNCEALQSNIIGVPTFKVNLLGGNPEGV